MEEKREVWQRGPIENIPALLQPVAHALLQAREELFDMMNGFSEYLLWERPGRRRLARFSFTTFNRSA